MISLGVSLEPLYSTLPVDECIAKIVTAGYRCVEFLHPEGAWDGSEIRTDWAKDAIALQNACDRHGVTLNDFALHAWDGSIGGSPVKPQDSARYIELLHKMIAFAKSAGCRKSITLSGTVDPSLSLSEGCTGQNGADR